MSLKVHGRDGAQRFGDIDRGAVGIDTASSLGVNGFAVQPGLDEPGVGRIGEIRTQTSPGVRLANGALVHAAARRKRSGASRRTSSANPSPRSSNRDSLASNAATHKPAAHATWRSSSVHRFSAARS